jgi:hypothetical protein
MKPGGQKLYTNLAIETALTVRAVFHLLLGEAEGFLRSVVVLLGLERPIPDHTMVSRRSKALARIPLGPTQRTGPLHIGIDGIGLRVHVGPSCKPPKNGHSASFIAPAIETAGRFWPWSSAGAKPTTGRGFRSC